MKHRHVSMNWIAGLTLLVLAPTALVAQAITPEQVVSIEQVGAVAMRPDGQLIAYTLTVPRTADEAFGRPYSELWIVPAAGGDATPVVEAPQSANSPRWSPDGSMLAFGARLGPGGYQVYVFPTTGGEARALTHSPLGVMSYAWSPDGKSIAYTACEPEDPAAADRRA